MGLLTKILKTLSLLTSKDFGATTPLIKPKPGDERILLSRLTWGSRGTQAAALINFYALSWLLKDRSLFESNWVVLISVTLPMLGIAFFLYTHEAYKGLYHISRVVQKHRALRYTFEVWLVGFFFLGISAPLTNIFSVTNEGFRFWYGLLPIPFFIFGEYLLKRVRGLHIR